MAATPITREEHAALEGIATNGSGPARGRAPFIARRWAEQLTAVNHYANGGEQLYHFSGGCYRPGDQTVRRQIVDLLGDTWTKGRSEEIAAYLRASAPELWERPPLDTVNCANGLLDVGTRTLEPHTPDWLSPVQIAAAFHSDASCPAIEAFIAATAPDLAQILYEIAGYLTVPDNAYQKALMLLGAGGTGKTTVLNLLGSFIGEHNTANVALHQLEEDRFSTADLYGRLANIFADLDSRALAASSIFKSITGGDRIRGERKHRAAFEFRPYARLLFSANDAPPTSDSSSAFFDRWLVLPFNQRHRGEEHCDPDIIDKLTTPAELSGLLNHALDGLARLRHQRGFSRAATSDHASERFRIDADSVAGFLEDRCDTDPESRIAKPALFRAYTTWCNDNNRRPISAQRANKRIRELLPDLDEAPSRGKDYWLGITTREDQP